MTTAASPLEQEALAALADYQRIAARMYTLDAHMGRRFLADGSLTGDTARIAVDVNPRLDRLWQRFNALRRLVEQVPTPGPDGFDADMRRQVSSLLREKAVRLDSAGLPVTTGTSTHATTVAELATAVEDECAELLDTCHRVDAACGRLADEMTDIGADLDYIDQLRRAEHLPDDTALGTLRRRRETEFEHALTDPVGSVDGRVLAGLATDVKTYAAALTSLEEVRRQYPRQLAGLREQVAALAVAEREVHAECVAVAAKIAQPRPPMITPVADTLSRDLAGAQRCADEGDWADLSGLLSGIGESIARGFAQTERARRTAAALLDRRAELRGRFSAYTSKAARLGVIEDDEVGAVFEHARRQLRTAPCDLPAATRAVYQFQQAIQTSGKETRR